MRLNKQNYKKTDTGFNASELSHFLQVKGGPNQRGAINQLKKYLNWTTIKQVCFTIDKNKQAHFYKYRMTSRPLRLYCHQPLTTPQPQPHSGNTTTPPGQTP